MEYHCLDQSNRYISKIKKNITQRSHLNFFFKKNQNKNTNESICIHNQNNNNMFKFNIKYNIIKI